MASSSYLWTQPRPAFEGKKFNPRHSEPQKWQKNPLEPWSSQQVSGIQNFQPPAHAHSAKRRFNDDSGVGHEKPAIRHFSPRGRGFSQRPRKSKFGLERQLRLGQEEEFHPHQAQQRVQDQQQNRLASRKRSVSLKVKQNRVVQQQSDEEFMVSKIRRRM